MKSGPVSIVFTLALFVSGVAHANPALRFPLQCDPGKNCWVVNYMDEAPGPDAQDYTCGSRTYDGHDGTDIGLPDRVAMETGVSVLAAAAGKVLRVRDEAEDREPSDKEMADLLKANRGCGNGVFIDHGGDWQTIYCHMKKGSVTVKPGQEVAAGDVLGQAGQSGAALFPHLHLGVLFKGERIDPFTGDKAGAGCAAAKIPLWLKDFVPVYEPAIVYAAGFHRGIPDFEAIKIDASSPRTLATDPGSLTFWAAFYGLKAGDKITLSMTAPDGRVLATRDIVQDKDRARQFFYIGRKAENSFLPGTYKGSVFLNRTVSGNPPFSRTVEKSVVLK